MKEKKVKDKTGICENLNGFQIFEENEIKLILKRFTMKIRETVCVRWLANQKYELVRKKMRILLCRVYKLKSWHKYILSEKPYALWVLKEFFEYNKFKEKDNIFVEIGCGLGDIIGNLGGIGYDADKNTINCAKLIHPFSKFVVGSFENVDIGHIDVLFCINFMHVIDKKILKNNFELLMKNNTVKMICFDTFLNESEDYPYIHKGEFFLDGKYHCIKRSRGFYTAGMNRRYIELWVKDE